jgi:hypothetical protein
VTRRLVLTGGALLERRPASYEVAERRQLAALAAVVRFAAEPTWLGLEWTDGALATMYILPGRDALLAALLDAAQACPRDLKSSNPCNPGNTVHLQFSCSSANMTGEGKEAAA